MTLPVWLLLILATYRPPAVVYANADTGMGKCQPFFSHYENRDGLCHRDSDGSALHVLLVPQEK